MDVPNAYAGFDLVNVPPGYDVREASYPKLRAAGFPGPSNLEAAQRKPESRALGELLASEEPGEIAGDEASTLLAEAWFLTLCDPMGTIVAIWDEGRWWTPEESETLVDALIAELKQRKD
jgi:hypothetical protein